MICCKNKTAQSAIRLLLLLILGWMPISLSAQWHANQPGIKWDATGTGRTTGHVITLTVYNSTPDALQSEIGPFFIPGNGQYQGYAINDTYSLQVPAFSTASIALQGYCTDIFDLPVPAGDAAPSPDKWVEIDHANPIPGPGWTTTATDGFQPRPVPDATATVLTYSGTSEAFLYQININEYPESAAGKLITAVNALEQSYDALVKSGEIAPSAFASDPATQRMGLVQQAFWYYTSLLQGTEYHHEIFQQQLSEQIEQLSNKPAHIFTEEVKEEVELTADNLWSTMHLIGQEAKLIINYENQQPMAPGFLNWLNQETEQLPDDAEEAIAKWLELKDTLKAAQGLFSPADFNRLNEQLDAQLPGLLEKRAEMIDPTSPDALDEIVEMLDFLGTDYTNSLTEASRQALMENLKTKLRQFLEERARINPSDPDAFSDILDLLDLLRWEYVTALLEKTVIEDIQKELQERMKDWLLEKVERIRSEDMDTPWEIWELLRLLDSAFLTSVLSEAVLEEAKADLMDKWREWLREEVDKIDPSEADAADKITNLHELLRTDYGEAAGQPMVDSLKQALEAIMEEHLSGRIEKLDPAQESALEEILKLLDLTQQGYGSKGQEKQWLEQLIEKINEFLRRRAELLDPDRAGFLSDARALAMMQEEWWYTELAGEAAKTYLSTQIAQKVTDWNSTQITPLINVSWPSVGLDGGQWKMLFPVIPPAGEQARGLSTGTWIAIIAVPVTGTAAYLLLRDGGGDEPPVLTPQDDALSIQCPGEGSINVLENDIGEGLQLSSFSQPVEANVSDQGNGVLLITALSGSSFSFPYTVTDRAGQSAQALVNVTVSLPPFAPADDAFAGTPGQAITGDVLTNDTGTELVITDFSMPEGGELNLTPATGAFTFSPMDGFCGETSFTYTLEDPCGQSGSATVILNLPDSGPPGITCPDDITISCEQEPDPELTGYPTATDDCDAEPEFNYADELGGTPCEQAVFRTWIARDDIGNEAACEQTITIVDEEAPEITCPEDIAVECSSSTAPDVTGMAEATDNCTTTTDITITFEDEGDEINILRNWKATDECDNTASCTQLIELIDEVEPTITCPPNLTISCEDSPDPAQTGFANATDNCDPEPEITFSDEISGDACNQIINRSWTATDQSGNVASCEQIIQVIDDIAPAIQCPPDMVLPCDGSLDPSVTGFPEVVDNCTPPDQLLVAFEDVEVGEPCFITIERTWTVTDLCGNSSSCVQTLTLEDELAPEITCPVDVTVICEEENNLEITGTPSVFDACSPPVTANFTDDLSGFENCDGFIIRTWTAVDACGNMNTCQQTIFVDPPQAPQFESPEGWSFTPVSANRQLPPSALPIRQGGLPEHPDAVASIQLEGMPVSVSWSYHFPVNLQLRYALGKGAGTLTYASEENSIHSAPLQYWQQEASLRLYHGQQRLMPYWGLGGQWFRLDVEASEQPRITLPPMQRDYWVPFLSGGLRINIWNNWQLEIEGQVLDTEERLRLQKLKWRWMAEMAVRF